MRRNIYHLPLIVLCLLAFGALVRELVPVHVDSLARTTPTASEITIANGMTPPIFEQLDVNQDDYVSEDEAKRSAEITTRFKQLDSDHDGKVSEDEFKNGMHSKF